MNNASVTGPGFGRVKTAGNHLTETLAAEEAQEAVTPHYTYYEGITLTRQKNPTNCDTHTYIHAYISIYFFSSNIFLCIFL